MFSIKYVFGHERPKTESTNPERYFDPLTIEGFSKGSGYNNSGGLGPHDAGWLEDFELNVQSLIVVLSL
jgi:hypothetical protein